MTLHTLHMQQRKISYLVSAAAAGLIGSILFSSPLPAFAGTVDQQQGAFGSIVPVNASVARAQTFTAGFAGLLDRIEVNISSSSATQPLTVEVRPLAGNGAPGASVLSTAKLQPQAGRSGWASLAVTPPVQVEAKKQYAFVLSAAGAQAYSLQSAKADVYAGGSSWASTTQPPAARVWSQKAPDLAFRTYVRLPDPRQEQFSGGNLPIDDFGSVAQTFTVSTNGNLDRVELYLNRGGAFDQMKVEIRGVNANGTPNTTVRDNAMVDAADAPAGWYSIDFPANINVRAGERYAIVAYIPVTGFPNTFLWYRSAANSYTVGQAWGTGSPPSSTWSAYPNDMAFRAIIRPPVTS